MCINSILVVVDGNEKCYRQRCISDDGVIELGEQIIHTGCDASPLRRSYFCSNHNSEPEMISSTEKDDK
jgi:hypothetical protein